MTQDKGQNQVVIDWLINGDADRTFVSTPEGELKYGELLARLPEKRTDRVGSVVPVRDLGSVLEIFRGVASGPLRVSDGRESFGHSVPGDVMTVLSTSGTAGQPKLVPLTIENWKAAVTASAVHLDHQGDDSWLIAMPFHHVGGLSVLFRSSFVGGGVRLLPSFEASAFADELVGGVSMASVVPRMLRRILDNDERQFNGLKSVLVGGGPIPAGLLEEAWSRGIPALPTYGMTETCAQVATLRPGSPLAYKTHLLPDVEARIDPDGRIALRGAQVFSGYVGEERRSPSEWFVTGDRGELDDEGALSISGRADDVIVTGGENVDPVAVEREMLNCPGVEAAMVVGVASDEWGSEIVCLYEGSTTGLELDEWARTRLEPFQVPKQWIKVGSIPTGPLGKPDRNKGRQVATRG